MSSAPRCPLPDVTARLFSNPVVSMLFVFLDLALSSTHVIGARGTRSTMCERALHKSTSSLKHQPSLYDSGGSSNVRCVWALSLCFLVVGAACVSALLREARDRPRCALLLHGRSFHDPGCEVKSGSMMLWVDVVCSRRFIVPRVRDDGHGWNCRSP